MMLFTEEMNLKMKNVLRWTAKTIVTKYHKFQTLYTPSQNIALDESLLMWKGWLEICQLIPNKAANRGIKTYEVCESQTGYLWRFEVHAQKKAAPTPSDDPLQAFTPAIVLQLIQGLEHKGHIYIPSGWIIFTIPLAWLDA